MKNYELKMKNYGPWIPAFAGMTESAFFFALRAGIHTIVIPANAGIQNYLRIKKRAFPTLNSSFSILN